MTIAGGAVYVAYDSGLLGNSEQGSEALRKAKAVIPPAMEEWMKYFGVEVEDARYKQLGLPGSVPLGLIQQKVKWFYKVVALNGSVLQTANLMSCTINV